MQIMAVGLDKLWKGQEKNMWLLENLDAKVNACHESLEQDNVTVLVQEEVSCI
jgi:hypothetical protein